MVMVLPTPPAAWIWWIHAAQGAGRLAHVLSEVDAERFCLINEINEEINVFLSTSMLNWIQAHPPATMVAEMAPIVADGSP